MSTAQPTLAIFSKPLFILEMANNHMGDVDHGIALVRAFGEVCRQFPFRFAFKLQYRDLDSFIHPAMRGRDDLKYIKRFSETRLKREQFDALVAEIRANGFLCISTPFDEASVQVIEEQELDCIKIASCSMSDWSLLERVVLSQRPLIVSTAGSTTEELDRLVSFLTHRGKDFAILHCVGEYPTPDAHMHLSQVDYLRRRYPGVRVGFSTHENPDNTDIIKIALAKGPILYSQGFHPHPRFSFATATSVGVESYAEYLDLFVGDMGADEALLRLNQVLPAGMTMLESVEVELKAPSLSPLIEATRYRVTLPGCDPELLQQQCVQFMAHESWVLTRQKKGQEQLIDLRQETRSLTNSGSVLEMVIGRGKAIELTAAVTGLAPEMLKAVHIEKTDVIFVA